MLPHLPSRGAARRVAWTLSLALWIGVAPATVEAATPKVFPPPDRTDWKPLGCRDVPAVDPILGPYAQWRALHADPRNSDEIHVALTPVLVEGWPAETNTFNTTGPVFDPAGNLYFTPLYPYENVILISLDPATGARRFSIAGSGSGTPPGAAAPLVLEDPASPGDQIIYAGVYDRVVAVRNDGTVVWDVGTGLTPPADPATYFMFGLNYLPGLDAIAGLTVDGFLFVLDRASGAPILNAPHQLPGSPSPPGDGQPIPPNILPGVLAELAPLMNLPPDPQRIFGILRGDGVEVANFFSVDPHSDRLWVAATIPDAEDGTVDGVSEFGALYRLDLVQNGPGYDVVEVCHRYFSGGSASTPALRADGGRVYVADNEGSIVVVDDACADQWELGVGAQIIGSIGVSSDNGELYAATTEDIFQVIDQGASGLLQWTANLDVFDLGFLEQQANLNLVSIGANGVSFQAGAGRGQDGVETTGVGVLDRVTGEVRYFAGGLDETTAVMSTGPDGALYIGNSPLRRAITRAVLPGAPALVGGIRKFEPQRLDLLVRDATCAAADRGENAASVRFTCPDSTLADIEQIQALTPLEAACAVAPIPLPCMGASAP